MRTAIAATHGVILPEFSETAFPKERMLDWCAVLQHGNHGKKLLSLVGALICGVDVACVAARHCRRSAVSFISNNAYNSDASLAGLKLPWHEFI